MATTSTNWWKIRTLCAKGIMRIRAAAIRREIFIMPHPTNTSMLQLAVQRINRNNWMARSSSGAATARIVRGRPRRRRRNSSGSCLSIKIGAFLPIGSMRGASPARPKSAPQWTSPWSRQVTRAWTLSIDSQWWHRTRFISSWTSRSAQGCLNSELYRNLLGSWDSKDNYTPLNTFGEERKEIQKK